MDPDRRQHPRFKVRVPVEFFSDGSDSPIRGATSDLSLSGCYIETVFPFAIGTRLELKLQIDGTLLVLATVATSDPQVGTGMNSPAWAESRKARSSSMSSGRGLAVLAHKAADAGAIPTHYKRAPLLR